MNSQQKNAENKDNTVGGAQLTPPDAEQQNDTGYAGTTNAVSEDRQHKDEYTIAPEDTMIGYDGDDEQMNMDLGDKDKRRTGSTGTGDND
jgi:hypothetical protein